ncbi:hypothetical protein [Gloeobacter violaceus]|uniref:Gsl2125 protein n=1 Tax=Gloeobacter violaceus (strain ATCC 29082 / PCC 7421) TaxID=251221 RepID=Q7NIQ7_GLOVI|nr:hypothetical protein [Gloeobacter violaceus]BAC90066.1 gsl2125 [Gloeobacter violaceus PCC 7421]
MPLDISYKDTQSLQTRRLEAGKIAWQEDYLLAVLPVAFCVFLLVMFFRLPGVPSLLTFLGLLSIILAAGFLRSISARLDQMPEHKH